MKIMNFFGTQTVRQASLLLILVSVFAKFAGFFRETVIAREFGVTADYDLFLIIFVVPASISITVNYTVSYALTPFYQKMSVDRGAVPARNFVSLIFLYGLAFFICCSAVTMMFGEYIIPFLTFTESHSDQQLAVQLLSILIWLLPLYFGVAVLQTILQAEHFFFAPSIGPLMQNTLIIAVLLTFGSAGVVALAYAWCAGLFAWFFWLFFTLYYTQGINFADFRGISERTSNNLLGAFLLSGFQIASIEIWPQLYVFFDRIAAQLFRLVEGSIAALGYATTLYTMVLSVFAMSIGRAIFPFLSAQVAKRNKDEQIKLLSRGVRWMILVSLPVTGGLFALSDEVVQLVYQRGHFDASATAATAGALKLFSVGLPFDSVYAILVGYFYALRDYRSLMIVALFSIIVKILVGVCLTGSFGYLGLASSTVIAVFCRAVFMTIRLNRHNVTFVESAEMRTLLWKSLLSVLPGTVLALYCVPLLSPLFLPVIKIASLTNFFIIIAGFGLIFFFYGFMLNVVRVPEWLIFVKKIQNIKARKLS